MIFKNFGWASAMAPAHLKQNLAVKGLTENNPELKSSSNYWEFHISFQPKYDKITCIPQTENRTQIHISASSQEWNEHQQLMGGIFNHAVWLECETFSWFMVECSWTRWYHFKRWSTVKRCRMKSCSEHYWNVSLGILLTFWSLVSWSFQFEFEFSNDEKAW
jgi:hypothetical protein